MEWAGGIVSSFAPQRRYSQNFLTDVGIARNIVGALQLTPQDSVVEIGPGKGALTTHLVDSPAKKIAAVELDARAVEFLRDQPWVRSGRVRIVQGDALTARVADILADEQRDHRCIIGNIPYAITSPLLFWMFDQRLDVSRAVFMMQREVARRCVANVGSKDYGILSVASWLYGSAKLMFHVQPGSFFPRPAVTSSVVRFDLLNGTADGLPQREFMDFVRSAFSQRRKVMTNALAAWSGRNTVPLREDSLHCGIDLSRARAEECSPDVLGRIYRSIQTTHLVRNSPPGVTL
ncbi:MAG: ribosomal RNA small subunit methyltransferase A [Candidatus Kapabacteria bacterium]|nr:ribosomal RNA small subunit methyltransferase A [Candidatus Kapabacteria bacterium]